LGTYGNIKGVSMEHFDRCFTTFLNVEVETCRVSKSIKYRSSRI